MGHMTVTHLVGNDEKAAVDQNGPNKNVTKDAGNERGRVGNHQGTIPVDSHKCPCQRSRDNGHVDEPWVGVVAEVERAEVEEIENQNDFSPVEVGANKEHDKGEMEQVVHDEVAADASRGVDDVGIRGEQMANVASLENEEYDPKES